MTQKELVQEAHNSARLGKHMGLNGDPRPHNLCDAHAIVSGAHRRAAPMRAVLAWFKRRIDDPINGCWLPRNKEAVSQMPDHLRRAVPHSRIHRKAYYAWISPLINLARISSDEELVRTLASIRHKLQTGTLPQHIIPKR
ncbi:AHH domain-containing protein [Microbulbifer thermotolerans]